MTSHSKYIRIFNRNMTGSLLKSLVNIKGVSIGTSESCQMQCVIFIHSSQINTAGYSVEQHVQIFSSSNVGKKDHLQRRDAVLQEWLCQQSKYPYLGLD